MLNQGKAIKFMVQRGGTTKSKNAENQLPIKIATIRKNKDARKNIRLAEKKTIQSKKQSLQNQIQIVIIKFISMIGYKNDTIDYYVDFIK